MWLTRVCVPQLQVRQGSEAAAEVSRQERLMWLSKLHRLQSSCGAAPTNASRRCNFISGHVFTDCFTERFRLGSII